MHYEKGKLYAPAYYEGFKCIADKCRHSCCIDWEITIDEATLEKYKHIPEIAKTVTECGGEAYFELSSGGRCPHLNSCGLCDIIISHGEGYLSDICRLHPRFFLDVDGHREAGLGLVCEEACRIILEAEEPFQLKELGEFSPDEKEIGFSAVSERDDIISFLNKETSGIDGKLAEIKKSYRIPEIYSADAWLERFSELEILDSEWEQELLAAKAVAPNGNDAEFEKYYTRLLTYFIARHTAEATSPDNFRARLGFAMLSAEIVRELFRRGSEHTRDALFELSRRYSAEIEYSEENTAELIFEFESSV